MATPNYATREFVVPAGGSLEVYREADELTCLDASAPFKLSIDQGPKFDFEAGLSLAADRPFTRLQFVNEGGAPNTIKVGIGKGGIRDARLVISGTVDTKETVPGALTTGSPVSATNAATTLIAAENLSRREIIIANDGGGKIYIGSSAGATAGQGIPLDAGQTMVLANTAAIYARNDSGAAVNVAVSEAS